MEDKQIKEFLEDIVEKYGKQSVSSVGKAMESLPTGSLSLDVSIGIGGIPVSRFTQIDGPEQTGKSTLCLSIGKGVVESGGKVAYIDGETSTDFGYVTDIIPTATEDNFVLLNPESAEDGFEMAESCLKEGVFKLIVLDSLPALAPEKEKENEFADDTMGILPRLTSKFLRRNGANLVKNSGTAFIFVNQVRDKINSYVPGYTTPGGHALMHWIALQISLSKGIPIEENQEKIGVLTKFTIKKNKVSIPYRSYHFPLIYGQGIDYYWDVIDFASMLGVLKKRGSYVYFEDTNIGQGTKNASGYLRNNPVVLDKIKEKVYEILEK